MEPNTLMTSLSGHDVLVPTYDVDSHSHECPGTSWDSCNDEHHRFVFCDLCGMVIEGVTFLK